MTSDSAAEQNLAPGPDRPVQVRLSQTDFPLPAADETAALCVITGVEGPSYRPLGAAMIVDQAGGRRGTLSSGCIEADVALHAAQALRDGRVRQLGYGRGSRAVDLELPCGGGLTITVMPVRDAGAMAQARDRLAVRQPAWIGIGADGLTTDTDAARLGITLLPPPRLLILGRGAEPLALWRMARAAGIDADFHSADPVTPAGALALSGRDWPAGAPLDARTAVALFFHDHDREPPLLARALASPAFYVGALGSARAHAMRVEALARMGLTPERIARMAQPFGVVPHARDPVAIASGVLAQVLDCARVD